MPDFMDRLRVLRQGYADHQLFAQQLAANSWILHAITDSSANQRTKQLASSLLDELVTSPLKPEVIRTLYDNLEEATFQESAFGGSAGWELTYAAVLSAAASFVGVLVGRDGLLGLWKLVAQTQQAIQPTQPVATGFLTPAETTIFALQALVALLVVVMSPMAFGSARAAPDTSPAKESYGQLKWGWISLWVSWVVLYGWLWSLGLRNAPLSPFGWFIADLFSTASSICFFWCFLVLDVPSVPLRGDPGRLAPFRRNLLWVASSAAGILVLSYLDRVAGWSEVHGLGPVANAFYAGLAMTFLFARFDSHRMSVPRWMLIPLYLYALLQTAWAIMTETGLGPGGTPVEVVRLYVFGVALVLKILVAVVVLLIVRSGEMRAYFDSALEKPRLRPAGDAAAEGGRG